MNPLFRRIRMKLLNENKTYKYLKYAVGEIVLIITGILIAIQISNWNEDRKTQVQFDLYIVRLIEDVRSAVETTEEAVKTYEESASNGTEILNVLGGLEDGSNSSDGFDRALDNFWKFIPPAVNVGLLGGLKMGDYSTINRDHKLAQSAMDMESAVEDWMLVHRESEDILNMQRSVAFRHYGNATENFKTSYDLEELKRSPEFRYAIQNAVHILEKSVYISSNIISELKQFLSDLEEYE